LRRPADITGDWTGPDPKRECVGWIQAQIVQKESRNIAQAYRDGVRRAKD